MAKKSVFYSFHFDNDVMRVQQIRNIGVIEDNAPVSPNEWEKIKGQGEAAIQRWIDENMRYKSCVVVLVGKETAYREWVQYEIIKAWNDKKGLLGVNIHNLKCPRGGTCASGPNPFENIRFQNGTSLSSVVKCYNPNPLYAYSEIAENLERWIDEAIAIRNRN